MHAYVITTKPLDSDPIQVIKNRLEGLGFTVVLIDGVKGAELEAGEYFRHIQFWRSHTGQMMTPGELGCTLSHHKTLSLAAQNGAGGHLVLEDDFIASDRALRWMVDACKQLSPGTLLHLGGLEGKPEHRYRYVRGDAIPHLPDTCRIDDRDLAFLQRTVAYAVDAATAEKLARLIEQTPYVIDHYAFPLSAGAIQQVWFRWVVSHPRDLSRSAIASERGTLGSTRKASSWRVRTWTEITRKRSMQFQLLWRRLSTNRKRFMKVQQPANQLPD
jgi:glycosyl transferase family 25